MTSETPPTITFRVTKKLKDRLTEEARKEGRSLSNYLCRTLANITSKGAAK